jgi:pyruvate formate lyase activating enzyme
MTVEALIEEALRDRVFHERSGGGVTFSGGEPLSQAPFVIEALQALKGLGVHTAVDTCGLVPREDLLAAGRLADLILFDVKHTDTASHEAWTGAPNGRILGNLAALGEIPARIWVRVPILPGANDDPENLRRTAALAAAVPGVERVSLLPYHRLGAEKRDRIGIAAPAYEGRPPETEHIRHIASLFEAEGLHAVIGG